MAGDVVELRPCELPVARLQQQGAAVDSVSFDPFPYSGPAGLGAHTCVQTAVGSLGQIRSAQITGMISSALPNCRGRHNILHGVAFAAI